MEAVMRTTWVVAADSGRARIFETEGTGKNFHEIQDFVNEAGRERHQDLRSDAKGRFWGKGERHQGHTAEPDIDAPRHETELFAKQVAEYLEKGRVEHLYDGLFLVADPQFLGITRAKLSNEAKQLIQRELPKDISWLDEKDIAEFYVKNRLPDS
jgi:protein required for attachment to host cells